MPGQEVALVGAGNSAGQAAVDRSSPDRARKGSAMAKNIYVGNLTWDTTADDLLALFQEHGEVARAQVITDRETGRCHAFPR